MRMDLGRLGLWNLRLMVCGLALSLLGGCGHDADDPIGSTELDLTAAVEQWRRLTEKHFKKQHVTWALNIIKCESGGDPNAYNPSGASGLFQHMKQYFADRASKAGFPGASPFDPEANIAAAAYLLYAPGGGSGHWTCKYSPFEDSSYQPQFYNDGQPIGPTDPGPTPTPAPGQCAALPITGGVIDDTSDCFEPFGPSNYWRAVNGSGHGGSLLWTNAQQAGTADNWARWSVVLGATGSYRVSYYAESQYAVFSNVRYVVRHGGVETPLTVNQSIGGTGWRELGIFSFNQGADQFVAVYDNSSMPVGPDQHIVADAIKLEPIDVQPAPAPGPQPAPAPQPQPQPQPQQPYPQQPYPQQPYPQYPAYSQPGGCSMGSGSAPGPAAPLLVTLLPLLFAAALRRRR